MTPTPETWLARMKKLEPTKLVRNIGAGLRLASALNWITFSVANITIVETQLTIVLPTIISGIFGVIDWGMHVWLRSKVTPQAKVDPMAEVLVKAEEAQARGEAVVIPPSVAATAKQVIGVDPSKVVNPL